jgi:Cu2+-exporting ATPase
MHQHEDETHSRDGDDRTKHTADAHTNDLGAGHKPTQDGADNAAAAEVHAGQEVAMHGSPESARAAPGQHVGPTEHNHEHAGHDAHAEHAHHGGHAGHSEEMFKRAFRISLVLTIPVLVYADPIQELLNYTAPQFPGAQYVGAVLGSIIYWYGGWLFLRGAVDELRGGRPGMMTLIALAISTAYFYSLVVTFELVAGMPFYWELATLVTIMLLGHWMEIRAVGSAQRALTELAKLLPDTAERIVDGHTETVPVSALRAGDMVLVRPGASVPADGAVVEGESEVDESVITGESRPVPKRSGDEVIAGAVNGSGSLRVRVTRTGEQTALAGIMRLVAEAQASRSRAQALADRAAFWLTIVAIAVAAITLATWVLARGFDNYTLERVVTVLVVACPHALGLAIPLVIAIATTLGARNGILARDRLALEEARNLTMVVFDKTGTLTEGELGLVDIAIADRRLQIVKGADNQQKQSAICDPQSEMLVLAAAVERDSEHMIAKAIVAAARERNLQLPTAQGFTAQPGRGVQATVGGRTLLVGGPRLLEQEQIRLPDDLAQRTGAWGERGHTVVYLVEDGAVLAAFALADVIRPESHEAVAALKHLGVKVAMLTGDSEDVARWVASELGIDTFFAQVLPQQKVEKIKELQRQGETVAMVGDGVNDAPALAQANVGIAIGAGTDVARAAAGIVLVRNDPRDVVKIIQLSRVSYCKMVQNLAWAVGYNTVALPLAAGVLAPLGLVMPAWVGAVLMSLSTIIVAINAQTLRRLDLEHLTPSRAAAQPAAAA